jgi:hypothetical protein
LKRNFRYAAALTAGCFKHLAPAVAAAPAARSTATAVGCLTGGAAVTAPARFVRESFARKELLLVCRKLKGAPAIYAVKGFVGVHLSLLSYDCRPLCGPACFARAISVNDASLRQIIWREFDVYPVARKNLDVMPAQTACDVRQNGVAVIQLD